MAIDARQLLLQNERILAYMRQKTAYYRNPGLNVEAYMTLLERRIAALRQKIATEKPN